MRRGGRWRSQRRGGATRRCGSIQSSASCHELAYSTRNVRMRIFGSRFRPPPCRCAALPLLISGGEPKKRPISRAPNGAADCSPGQARGRSLVRRPGSAFRPVLPSPQHVFCVGERARVRGGPAVRINPTHASCRQTRKEPRSARFGRSQLMAPLSQPLPPNRPKAAFRPHASPLPPNR